MVPIGKIWKTMFPTFGKIRLHLENCTTIKEECIKEEKKKDSERERERKV